jgi:hypothetical protein
MNVSALLAAVAALAISAAVGCAAPADPSSDDTAAGAEAALSSSDLAAANDPVLIANAKKYVEHIDGAEGNYWSSEGKLHEIPYKDLPSKLAKSVTRDNPDPKAEWAAVALTTTVLDSKGESKTIYVVIDGIDDEGEDFTIYTSGGKKIAEGDDYRGLHWN